MDSWTGPGNAVERAVVEVEQLWVFQQDDLWKNFAQVRHGIGEYLTEKFFKPPPHILLMGKWLGAATEVPFSWEV